MEHETMDQETLEMAIRARLVEAAKTERKLPDTRTRPDTAKGYWPEYRHAWSDMVQWGTPMDGATKAGIATEKRVDTHHPGFDPEDPATWRRKEITRLDGHNGEVSERMMRSGATAAEVSRLEKCTEWVIHFVQRPEERRSLLAWCMRQATKGEKGGFRISEFARRENIERHTVKQRADRAIAEIAREANRLNMLNADLFEGGFQNSTEIGSDFDTLEELGAAERGHSNFFLAEGARPSFPDLSDEQAVAATARGVSEARERIREIKRRRKLGVEAEAS